MNKNILQFLGLCKKSGRLTLGFDACMKSINQKQSKLILVTNDISERTLKKFFECKNDLFDLIALSSITKDNIKDFLGKSCGVISINDEGFAKKIKQLITN